MVNFSKLAGFPSFHSARTGSGVGRGTMMPVRRESSGPPDLASTALPPEQLKNSPDKSTPAATEIILATTTLPYEVEQDW